ncbi:hypothetical protein ECG_06356 [Echinococcus granulosus]|nr:hypothetical protein ECG_06356 [Echinococcus granulosus]
MNCLVQSLLPLSYADPPPHGAQTKSATRLQPPQPPAAAPPVPHTKPAPRMHRLVDKKEETRTLNHYSIDTILEMIIFTVCQ